MLLALIRDEGFGGRGRFRNGFTGLFLSALLPPIEPGGVCNKHATTP
jgi:hypothetical protein